MPEQKPPPVSRRELFLRASGVSFLTGVFSFFSVPVLVNYSYCLIGIDIDIGIEMAMMEVDIGIGMENDDDDDAVDDDADDDADDADADADADAAADDDDGEDSHVRPHAALLVFTNAWSPSLHGDFLEWGYPKMDDLLWKFLLKFLGNLHVLISFRGAHYQN